MAARLRQRAASTPEFWSFVGRASRENGHGTFAYPAMMVPQLQGALLDDVLEVDATVSSVLDPFMGSGTVLLESARRGLSFFGADINPLAVLLSEVKSRPHDIQRLEEVRARVASKAAADTSEIIAVDFINRDKWFRRDVAIALSRLRRAICEEPERVERQVLWVALAETIRLVSNSRTSTVKLHAYSPADIAKRVLDAHGTFLRILAEHIDQLRDQAAILHEGLSRSPKLTISCKPGDARTMPHSGDPVSDVLMTSPPYGDNITTVTYGQHSYLPLQWMSPDDVPGLTPELLLATRSIDSASLGGKLKDRLPEAEELCARSPAFQSCFEKMQARDRNARVRLTAFTADLDESLDSIVARLRDHAWMFWTLGERRISGITVPTVSIVRDLLCDRGARHIETLERKIPAHSKRMALRNASVETMNTESVLVMRGPARRQERDETACMET
ncbi:hypothetical protein ACGFZQ_42965 [Streptomyces sp. NPDC048254]|uniref:hypothetical protein n=1 Tax=Streptomyces sp. NPDC048254 TaxID=3365525 RepID=UPI0037207D7A